MLRHDDEFVELKAAQLAIFIQHIQQQPREILFLEKRTTEMRD